MAEFNDPLDALMNRHGATKDPSAAAVNLPVDEPEDDDPFGMNDQAAEIAAENEAAELARIAHQEELAAQVEATKAELKAMPPRSLDPEFQKDSVEFQESVLEIVGNMIQKVVTNRNLTAGCIPESTDDDPKHRDHAMGDLIEYYHNNGDKVTPEFEEIVLKYWRYGYTEAEKAANKAAAAAEIETTDEIPKKTTPEIVINAEEGKDVTVNIDPDVVKEMSEEHKVNVRIVKTTDKDMFAAKRVILNSERTDIIQPFEVTTATVPITLPLSGYRCEITPMSYWEFIQLTTARRSGSNADMDLRTWSIIYNHITNPSIGPFTDFEDFLKKTKYADIQILLYGVLLSSCDEVEPITLLCGNPKCREPHEIHYNPRSIMHVNDELMAKYEFKKSGTLFGKAAKEHFEKINNSVVFYELPHSKYIVEIEPRQSAYDYLNRVYPLLDELEARFNTEDKKDTENEFDDEEFAYLAGHGMYILSMSKIVGDTVYKYTDFADIEKILTTALDTVDAGTLIALIRDAGADVQPVQFFLEDITCDKCGRHEDRLMIPDIGRSLLFQLSQRLSSTKISLIETEQT